MAHAAGSGSDRHPAATMVVVLAADSSEHLCNISSVLRHHDLGHTVVTETEGVYAGQAMAIGLELVTDRGPVRKVVSSLPLLR